MSPASAISNTVLLCETPPWGNVYYGIDPDKLIHVFQYNKRDLKGVVREELMTEYLNPNRYPVILSSAIQPDFATDTLLLVVRRLLESFDNK